jgi:hypothetical protein
LDAETKTYLEFNGRRDVLVWEDGTYMTAEPAYDAGWQLGEGLVAMMPNSWEMLSWVLAHIVKDRTNLPLLQVGSLRRPRLARGMRSSGAVG